MADDQLIEIPLSVLIQTRCAHYLLQQLCLFDES